MPWLAGQARARVARGGGCAGPLRVGRGARSLATSASWVSAEGAASRAVPSSAGSFRSDPGQPGYQRSRATGVPRRPGGAAAGERAGRGAPDCYEGPDGRGGARLVPRWERPVGRRAPGWLGRRAGLVRGRGADRDARGRVLVGRVNGRGGLLVRAGYCCWAGTAFGRGTGVTGPLSAGTAGPAGQGRRVTGGRRSTVAGELTGPGEYCRVLNGA